MYHGWLVDLLTRWRDLRRRTASLGGGTDEADDEAEDASDGNRQRRRHAPSTDAAAAAAASSETPQVEAAMARCLLRLGDLGVCLECVACPSRRRGCSPEVVKRARAVHSPLARYRQENGQPQHRSFATAEAYYWTAMRVRTTAGARPIWLRSAMLVPPAERMSRSCKGGFSAAHAGKALNQLALIATGQRRRVETLSCYLLRFVAPAHLHVAIRNSSHGHLSVCLVNQHDCRPDAAARPREPQDLLARPPPLPGLQAGRPVRASTSDAALPAHGLSINPSVSPPPRSRRSTGLKSTSSPTSAPCLHRTSRAPRTASGA